MIIYKYALETTGRQKLQIPSPQNFLSVQLQRDKICVWYEVDEAHDQEDDVIEFVIVGTGHRAPDVAQHLGTVQMGGFVWHVYARKVQ